ncbi:MAG: response regulator transcription factor [Bacteriovoracaceae bacterium]|nr:response regulator transcription factor [Bacteriovoracaceae bacterium]
MATILVVEDDLKIQKIIEHTLKIDHKIVTAGTIEQCEKKLERETYDLILLDVSLPDGDGYHLCTKLKNEQKTAHVPILFITGMDSVNDKVMGLSLGADDYITKPFNPIELKARVTANLRKYKSEKHQSDEMIKGDLRVSLLYHKIYVVHENKEIPLSLTPLEYKLLLHFLSHEGHVLSREQLISSIWFDDLSITDRVVDTHISHLRKKIIASNYKIKPVYGVGYTLEFIEE